jgi:hypothetical protein
MSTESIRKTEITSSNIPERSRRLAWLGPPPLFEGEDAAAYDERLARIAEAMKPEEKLILLQVRCLEPLIPASAAATSLGFLYTANSSRAVGGRRSRSHRRCWPSGPHLGERWPSRLVATAEEDRLSFRRNPHTSFAAASDCRTIAIYEYTPKTPPRPSSGGVTAALAVFSSASGAACMQAQATRFRPPLAFHPRCGRCAIKRIAGPRPRRNRH